MAYLLQHAVALLFLAVVLWLPGCLLEKSKPIGNSGLRPLARIVLGLGFWIACTFLLAVCGLLRPWALWAMIGLITAWALAAWIRSSRFRSIRFRSSHPIVRPVLPSTAETLVLMTLTAVLTPLCLLAFTPTVSWDASAYHLTLPRLFLDHGGFREVPLNVYSYWPLNVQLLFSLAIAIDGYVLAKLLHFAIGVTTLYALVVGCRALHRPASGMLAAIFFIANGVVAYELRVAYVDLAHALFLLAGVLFMIEALELEPRALWLSGLCCGLAAGTKLTGIVGAIAVGALYLPRLAGALRRREPALRDFLVRFAAPVLGLWTPWVIRTAVLTGNPAYPFFHRWLGGPDWSPDLSERLQAWQSSIGMGREPIDYLLLPLRVSLAGGQGYARFDGELAAFWIVLVPLALWTARRVMLVRRCLVVAAIYFVFWSLSSQQIRLLIPALPLLAIAGAVALIEVVDRLSSQRWRRAVIATAFAAAAISMVVSQGAMLAAGYRTLTVYLRAEGDLTATVKHPVYTFINENLPSSARVLFLNTNQRFFCEREVIADSFFEASQIADWLAPAPDVSAARELLNRRGVTHVLVEHRFRGAVYPETLANLLRDPSQIELLFRSQDGRFSVFALRTS